MLVQDLEPAERGSGRPQVLELPEREATAEFAVERSIGDLDGCLSQGRDIAVEQHPEERGSDEHQCPHEPAGAVAPAAAEPAGPRTCPASVEHQKACPTARWTATGAPKRLGGDPSGCSLSRYSSTRKPRSRRTGPMGVGYRRPTPGARCGVCNEYSARPRRTSL